MVRGGYTNTIMRRRGGTMQGNRNWGSNNKGGSGGTRNFSVGRSQQRGGYRQSDVRNSWDSNTRNNMNRNQNFRQSNYSIASRRGFSNNRSINTSRRPNTRGTFQIKRGMRTNRGGRIGMIQRGSRRGRGGIRGGRGGRGRGGRGGPLTRETLDSELDAYMGDDVQKTRLDHDLDSYFGRGSGSSAAESTTATENETSNIGMEVNMDGSL